jgi:hypothetical protein
MKREAGQVVPPPFFPLSGKSSQSDGGRLAGRVLACLYNPANQKKVPAKHKKVTRITVEESRQLSSATYHATPRASQSR